MNRRKPISFFLLSLLTLLLVGCGGGIDVVDAGTYTGTVDKVVAGEEEIYVSLENGARLELYFSEGTALIEDGEVVPFSSLEEGAMIEVEVDREGNRNLPLRVEILE
jgi:hypothetical protein